MTNVWYVVDSIVDGLTIATTAATYQSLSVSPLLLELFLQVACDDTIFSLSSFVVCLSLFLYLSVSLSLSLSIGWLWGAISRRSDYAVRTIAFHAVATAAFAAADDASAASVSADQQQQRRRARTAPPAAAQEAEAVAGAVRPLAADPGVESGDGQDDYDVDQTRAAMQYGRHYVAAAAAAAAAAERSENWCRQPSPFASN